VATSRGLPSDAELAHRSAILRLPQWMAGGEPAAFGQQCRWRLEELDRSAGEWRARLDERVRRNPARLVQVHQLATAANADKRGAYSRLRRLLTVPAVGSSLPPERIQAELDRLASADPSRPVVPRERRSPGIEHKNAMPAAPPCPQNAVSATTAARRGNA
jgi:hypothetical protein